MTIQSFVMRIQSLEVIRVRATVGDRLRIHGRHVADGEQQGKIVEVRGDNGRPPYVVRFNDGHEGLIFPGSDSVVETEES